MSYSIHELAKIAGVSARTLRYYEQIGLLCPKRDPVNGYRIYESAQVDRLQQILFYREMDVPLAEIERIMSSESFDAEAALNEHLRSLHDKRERLEQLIQSVEKTISAKKGESIMNDAEKFEGFKKNLIEENEKQYGEEIREKYGDETVDHSNAKLMGMNREQYEEAQRLGVEVNETFRKAFEQGDPAGELAQRACELHKRHLCYYWPQYSPEAHVGVTKMYVEDERFRAYYDKIVPGLAVFIRDAVSVYCG